MVGDVVLAPFPFTDLSEIKVRPAVVVANVGTQDWVLCEITSSSQLRSLYIAIGPGDMERGRLRHRGWARPDRLYDPERHGVRKEIGPPLRRQARRDRSRRPQPVLTEGYEIRFLPVSRSYSSHVLSLNG